VCVCACACVCVCVCVCAPAQVCMFVLRLLHTHELFYVLKFLLMNIIIKS